MVTGQKNGRLKAWSFDGHSLVWRVKLALALAAGCEAWTGELWLSELLTGVGARGCCPIIRRTKRLEPFGNCIDTTSVGRRGQATTGVSLPEGGAVSVSGMLVARGLVRSALCGRRPLLESLRRVDGVGAFATDLYE